MNDPIRVVRLSPEQVLAGVACYLLPSEPATVIEVEHGVALCDECLRTLSAVTTKAEGIDMLSFLNES